MSKSISIKQTINPFNNTIKVAGDKSLSIRWVLLASQTTGKSTAYNLLMSGDVLAAINAIKRLGIKVKVEIIIVKFLVMELMDLDIKKI
jgi:3-phosphoshikimate 1-carboxyvinyltransferase